MHGLEHAERYAIHLAWDLVARFGCERRPDEHGEGLAESWATLAGGKDAAGGSRGSLAARLVAVHMTHEARGLDVFPGMHARLSKSQASGDIADASMLLRNATDEVEHVRAGVKWFRYV